MGMGIELDSRDGTELDSRDGMELDSSNGEELDISNGEVVEIPVLNCMGKAGVIEVEGLLSNMGVWIV